MMIYKIRVIADVKEDVIRDIAIGRNANLEDLHNAITNAFGFDGTEMASFYKTDLDWVQGDEIPLQNMNDNEETATMNDFLVNDLFVEREDKLIYVYDFYLLWTFFVELIEISENKHEIDLPSVIFSVGNLPEEVPEKQFEGEKIKKGFEMFDDDDNDNIIDLNMDNLDELSN